jgi:urea transport system substrate-binding protein
MKQGIEEMKLTRRSLLTSAAAAAAMTMPRFAFAEGETIKVGVLHSLSGTMAISETTLKDTMLMLIEQQNAKGGLLGKQLEAVVVDPASDWPLFAEKARELLTVSKVDVMFGCWTSVSRKSVLPVIEELNGLLFYPVQYEGEESSKNVFYTGAAPNQQAIPAVDYYLEELGVQKFALLGTDYVYPRTTNNILEAYLISKGIPKEDIFVNYTPFGHSDWSKIVGDVVALGADGKKVGVISTINGDANIGFYKELAAAGVTADTLPVVAFSVGEEELRAAIPPTSPVTSRPGTTSCRPIPRKTRPSSLPGKPSSRMTSASPTTRWKRITSASTCG